MITEVNPTMTQDAMPIVLERKYPSITPCERLEFIDELELGQRLGSCYVSGRCHVGGRMLYDLHDVASSRPLAFNMTREAAFAFAGA